MEWKNQLTKTPYLVLFIILISVGVGTASALITITLAGDVVVTGDLSIGTTNADDDDIIKFDDGSQEFFWDESQNRFQIGDALQIEGPFISSFGDPANVGYSRIGSATSNHGLNGINDFLVTDMLEVNGKTFLDGDLDISGDSASDNDSILFDDGTQTLQWDNAQTRFEFTNSLHIPVIGTAGLFIGTDDAGNDDRIWMDGANEVILWDESDSQFHFSDAITAEIIQGGNFGPNAAFNRMGFGGPLANQQIFSSNDLYVGSLMYCCKYLVWPVYP